MNCKQILLHSMYRVDHLLDTKGKYTFNVGTGNGLSVLDVITSFEQVNDVKVNYVIGARRKGDIEQIYSNGNLIKNVLGWKPIKSIQEALISAWKWQNSYILHNSHDK